MPAGKGWRFHHWIWRNTAYLDNYVERTDSSRTTYYIGNHYEVSTPPTTTTKYYYFGAQRVAMQNAQGITYLHGDHLGSTSVTSGATSSTQVYYPFGAVRASSGSLQTDFTFTGQKFDASAGLMYYGARYYDAALGRFISADTIVPSAGNPQALNRYAYTLNNPVRYVDPTGHQGCEVTVCEDPGEGGGGRGPNPPAVTGGDQTPSGGDHPGVNWSLPTAGQAFDIYFSNLCGDFCGFTLRIMPPGLKGLAMLFADEGGSFGGIRYRSELTPEEKAEQMQRAMWLAVGMTAPVKAEGEFSIIDWSGYPGGPKPSGPFRVVEGAEYAEQRAVADAANRAMHESDMSLKGKHIHEIQPVKLGGSPTDPANKIALTPPEHYAYTAWWNAFLRGLTTGQ